MCIGGTIEAEYVAPSQDGEIGITRAELERRIEEIKNRMISEVRRYYEKRREVVRIYDKERLELVERYAEKRLKLAKRDNKKLEKDVKKLIEGKDRSCAEEFRKLIARSDRELNRIDEEWREAMERLGKRRRKAMKRLDREHQKTMKRMNREHQEVIDRGFRED